MAPISDGSGDIVFQGRVEHIPIEEPTVSAPEAAMVERHNMSIEHYFPEAQITRVQRHPNNLPLLFLEVVIRGRGLRTSPLESPMLPLPSVPPTAATITGNPPTRGITPKLRTTEQPTITSTDVASFSTLLFLGWQGSFRLGERSFPTNSSVQT